MYQKKLLILLQVILLHYLLYAICWGMAIQIQTAIIPARPGNSVTRQNKVLLGLAVIKRTTYVLMGQQELAWDLIIRAT